MHGLGSHTGRVKHDVAKSEYQMRPGHASTVRLACMLMAFVQHPQPGHQASGGSSQSILAVLPGVAGQLHLSALLQDWEMQLYMIRCGRV